MRHFVCAVTTLLVLLPSLSIAAQLITTRSIVIGGTQDAEMSGCQIDAKTQTKVCDTHSFQVNLPANKYWRIEAEQLGIDIVLSIVPPGGQKVITVNTPIGRSGLESALLYSDVRGSYEMRLSSQELSNARGKYKLRITELDNRIPSEQRLFEAEKAMTEAAELFFRGTDTADAIPKYEKAVMLWRELGNPTEEARAAYCVAVLYLELDDAEKARDYFMRALELLEQLGDLNTLGYVLDRLGLTLDQLGNSRQAKQRLQQARALGRKLADPYLEAMTLNSLGLLFHFGGNLTQAKQYYQAALQLFKQQDELDEQATTINNIAGIYYVLGEPDPAFDYMQQALSLSRRIGNTDNETTALGNMAALYRITGDLKKALTSYVELLATARATGNQREEAWTLGQISLTYYDLGEYARALAFANQALPLWRKFNDRRGEAMTLTILGEIRLALGETRQALDVLGKAVALRKGSEEAVGEADALLALGRAHLKNDDTGAAARSFEIAFDILKSVGDKRRQATALLWRGIVATAENEPGQALNTLKHALALHRSSHNQAGEAETLYQMAVAHRALGALDEAQKHIEAALVLIESLRTNISNPALRSTFLSIKHDAYQLSIDNLMGLHRQAPDKRYQQKALEASERARARTLLDLLHEAGADIDQDISSELRERRAALLREINAKTETQQQLLSREHSDAEARKLEFELQSKLSELDDLETRIRIRHPEYASLTQSTPLSIAEIQGLLDPDTLFLEYALGDQRSFLWAVTSDAVHSVELPPRQDIELLARRLYQSNSTVDLEAWRDEQKLRAEMAHLLLDPVARHLNRQRIVIAADGALHYVPFGALPVPRADVKPGDSARQVELLQDHEVLYLPSASTLATLRGTLATRRQASKQIAILADPVFERSDPRMQTIEVAASSSANQFSPLRDSTRQVASQVLQRLVFSRGEATTIAELVPKQQRLLALDFDASRATARGEEIEKYRIVHFATHGMLNSQNPELSGLTLSRYDKTGASQPAFLALHDVYNLKLAANLVVLSGCQTALGKEIRGEGLVGLTRGFMYAGAPRVLASLWRVSDQATAALMGRFYRAMFRQGLQPAAALRVAQLSIKNDPEKRNWRDPYYWAGFTLQGDWQ